MGTLLAETAVPTNDKGLKIIARSIFKELKQNGYDSRQIVSLSTELIGLVTTDLRSNDIHLNASTQS